VGCRPRAGAPQIEQVLADRALSCATESVFYHGEDVATRRRDDARLLLAHLARLNRLQNTGNVYRTVNQFDQKLEDLRHLREGKFESLAPGDDPDN
jgi:hypothetical protein